MARTQIRGSQVFDKSITRDDLDITTPAKAVITNLVQGTGIFLQSTGIESGTGEVTISSLKNIDGGSPSSTYMIQQHIDGGGP